MTSVVSGIFLGFFLLSDVNYGFKTTQNSRAKLSLMSTNGPVPMSPQDSFRQPMKSLGKNVGFVALPLLIQTLTARLELELAGVRVRVRYRVRGEGYRQSYRFSWICGSYSFISNIDCQVRVRVRVSDSVKMKVSVIRFLTLTVTSISDPNL
jgi:hypothetical protein